MPRFDRDGEAGCVFDKGSQGVGEIGESVFHTPMVADVSHAMHRANGQVGPWISGQEPADASALRAIEVRGFAAGPVDAEDLRARLWSAQSDTRAGGMRVNGSAQSATRAGVMRVKGSAQSANRAGVLRVTCNGGMRGHRESGC